MVKKYQIVQKHGEFSHTAGKKAPNDVESIATKLGFEKLYIHDKTGIIPKISHQLNFFNSWKNVFNNVEQNSILLFQFPTYGNELGKYKFLKKLKREKNTKIILLVHDINSLRPDNTKSNKDRNRELKDLKIMFSLADKLIVHNLSMIDYLEKQGIAKDKLINLEIFDYLSNEITPEKSTFDKSITIAGNLSIHKSPYLNQISKINSKFYLYGPNCTLSESSNLHYMGSVAPDELPKHLNKGFGLIWDGSSIDTCDGITGNYLKYINPHKLSLYLSSGLPVIIWSQAAEANFVKKNKVGITIDSLLEIPDILSSINKEEYSILAQNTLNLGKDLLNGEYTKRALYKAIQD